MDTNSVLSDFKRDTASHTMRIIRDDGVCRHIRFARPGTTCMHFDLITWPGYLCYTGDMGTFVFAMLDDMFEFFRVQKSESPDLFRWIDTRYWAEKLQATDMQGGNREWCKDAFARAVTELRRSMLIQHTRDWDRDDRLEFWEELDGVKRAGNDGEHAAICAVSDFVFLNPKTGRHIHIDTSDFPTCYRKTYRFLWCCYALRWAVNKYDETHKESA